MADFPVDPSCVTPEWLSHVLGTDVRECRLERIGIGIGLLGRLYRVHLVGGPEVPTSVVVKFPTLDALARSTICEDLEFYLREVSFYQQIGLANPLPPARPYFAAFDEATHDFVLVIEDLGRLRLADQTLGCTEEDAATVVDAIARHHAHWWESDRFSSLKWLKAYDTPPFPAVLIGNFEASWPRFVESVGADLPPRVRAFGERFPSMIPWFLEQITRRPRTFLHGDLRLDQLFFAVGADDPAVTALDWQMTSKGRGAYDVAYFLSQSLTTDARRACEGGLIDRYAERLASCGIAYPADELRRDYRITTAWCFAYPVLGAGQIEPTNQRHEELLRAMSRRAVSALEDHDAMSLRPD